MSEKLQLPSVTLICIDCVNANRAVSVLELCKDKADFGAVKLLTSLPIEYQHKIEIPPLNTLVAYSIFMLTKVHEFINTEHLLVVQRDGFILNPQSFNQEWLTYDYIAPIFVQYNHVGSGGFSLRTNRMMQEVSASMPHWDWSQEKADEIQRVASYYEDGVISFTKRKRPFKIAPLEEAANFAQGGNRDPKYYRPHPFGYHGLWSSINVETGLVQPVCEHTEGNCECVMGFKNYLKGMEV